MRSRIIVLTIVAAVLFALAGCATTTQAGITYHNANKDKETFWMTIMKTSPDGTSQAAALWYCQGSKESPVCTQVRLVRCQEAKDCQFNATQIFQSSLGI